MEMIKEDWRLDHENASCLSKGQGCGFFVFCFFPESVKSLIFTKNEEARLVNMLKKCLRDLQRPVSKRTRRRYV